MLYIPRPLIFQLVDSNVAQRREKNKLQRDDSCTKSAGSSRSELDFQECEIRTDPDH